MGSVKATGLLGPVGMFAGTSEFFSFAVTFYNCSVGHTDCSRCQTADSKYNCVWCGGDNPSCIFRGSCKEEIEDLCPAPLIHSVSNLLTGVLHTGQGGLCSAVGIKGL